MLRCAWETQVRHQQQTCHAKPRDTFTVFLNELDWKYCLTLNTQTPPGLQSKKHQCSNWLCILHVLKFWTHNTDAGLCITESKQSKTARDEIWIKQSTISQLHVGLCVLTCVKSGTLWTVAGQLWPFPPSKDNVQWINRGPRYNF